MRACLHALKFDGREALASLLAEPAWRRHVLDGDLRGADFVVPMPLSRSRRRERGFNQAERIARQVARRACLPLADRALWRTGQRPPQAGLSAPARRRNVRGVFRARLPRSLHGARALLVDDVLTTGATAEAASGALLRAGAGEVDVLTLARVP